ncbi:hypothetical protein CALVIDRAFT_526800 [Calocera viscosa TUFC12733]|uniref:Uncharacterized protein n=1 Tax=Calocera viscosa (strain TUFC12733) TaxID=1330018 RepID=A0A167N1K9_CALVF|nr:hypothetical protein CALVIDRAFT_526800 [Calocera viscosa TUFC12733]
MVFATAGTGHRNPARRGQHAFGILQTSFGEKQLDDDMPMSESMKLVLDQIAEAEKVHAKDPTWKPHASVEQRLARPAAPTLDFEPTVISARRDQYRGGLLSVEGIELVRFEVISRTPAQAAQDQVWLDAFRRELDGRTAPSAEFAMHHAFHEGELHARGPADWTVFAQHFNLNFPHRPYCEGPPVDPLSAKVHWVLLLQEAFSRVKGTTGITTSDMWAKTPSIVHPRWVAHLKRFWEHILQVIRARLKTAPDHNLRLRYHDLDSLWCAKFEWEMFKIPLEFREAEQLWLLAQCKTRDALGIANRIDSAFLGNYQFSEQNRPWTRNFVGVLEDSLPADRRKEFFRAGVPVLRAHTGDSPYDECLTDAWVQAEVASLLAAASTPAAAKALHVDQVRHSAARDGRQQKNAARPSSAQRKRIKKLQAQQASSSADTEVGQAVLQARGKQRQSVRDVQTLYGPSAAFPKLRKPGGDYANEPREAEWQHYPGYFPGAEVLHIPVKLGHGTTSESMMAHRPPAELQPSPYRLENPLFSSRIAEPFRSYALEQAPGASQGPAPAMPHKDKAVDPYTWREPAAPNSASSSAGASMVRPRPVASLPCVSLSSPVLYMPLRPRPATPPLAVEQPASKVPAVEEIAMGEPEVLPSVVPEVKKPRMSMKMYKERRAAKLAALEQEQRAQREKRARADTEADLRHK